MTNLMLWGFISTLVFKSFMSMGGVGAAFILVPIFYWLGMPFPQAAVTGLMLGVLNTGVASINYARDKLINYKVSLPLIVSILVFSPIGVYCSNIVNKNILLSVFVVFLLFSESMMLFYHPRKADKGEPKQSRPVVATGVGSLVGFLSGLLGVGGRGFLGPFLVWMKLVAAKIVFDLLWH